jgi:tRNA pseudouridine55 synthase
MVEMASGFLFVDKPAGVTSHDVVAALRRALAVGKVGHAGTLDPMATGLLVVAVGRATRLLRFVQDLPKEYLARIMFGVATDTLDADGAVLWREPMPFAEEELEAVLPRFVGAVLQVPPMVSAVRVGGRRLYELHRAGETVDREPRPVEIQRISIEEFAPGDYPEAVLSVRCGKGMYVRVLADDIAAALGGRAHLCGLRRTRVGSIDAERDAVPLDRLVNAIGEGQEALGAIDAGLRDLPEVTVDGETARGVGHGASFGFGFDAPSSGPFRVYDGHARLIAVYRVEGRLAVPEVVLDAGSAE